MKWFKIVALLSLFNLLGCLPQQLPTYEPGASVPPGKILVIAQLDLRPGVTQGEMSKTHFTVGGTGADEARMYMSPVANIPVNKDAVIPFDLKGASQMNLSYDHPSVVLMDSGVRFVRMGEFTLSATTTWRRNAVGEMRGGANVEKLTLYGDLKLDIPAKVKAVYVGTLRYEHDGVESQKVIVVDEYKKTMKKLDQMKIGISSKDVVKSLAKVVREN